VRVGFNTRRILSVALRQRTLYLGWSHVAPPDLAASCQHVWFMSTASMCALNILYSKRLADHWIQLPNTNPMFEGDRPLTYLIKGGVPAMLRVRQLLDARRGGR
jgi:hypothetical protein